MGKIQNLTGKTFNRWTVLGPAERRYNRAHWLCRCVCGSTRTVAGIYLKNGRSKSCGCLQKEVVAKLGEKSTHGKTKTPEYQVWRGMKKRCHNPNTEYFKNYGGRGISVCKAWRESFSTFLNDVGPRPTANHSIDRIDNDKGYDPNNCRWATTRQQENNKRTNVYIKYKGKTLTIKQWSRRLNIKYITLYRRLNSYGWSIEKSFTQSVRKIKH